MSQHPRDNDRPVKFGTLGTLWLDHGGRVGEGEVGWEEERGRKMGSKERRRKGGGNMVGRRRRRGSEEERRERRGGKEKRGRKE